MLQAVGGLFKCCMLWVGSSRTACCVWALQGLHAVCGLFKWCTLWVGSSSAGVGSSSSACCMGGLFKDCMLCVGLPEVLLWLYATSLSFKVTGQLWWVVIFELYQHQIPHTESIRNLKAVNMYLDSK